MPPKVAIVTGSNKGIGFAIVRGLCKKFQGDVYLTSRDTARGLEAVKKLEQEGLKPKFHQLDINDRKSIETLSKSMQSNYGGIDLLVNNAAIAFKAADPTPFAQQAPVSMRTNYTALLEVCDLMFPLLRPGARVVHLASMAGEFTFKKLSAEKKKQALEIVASNDMDRVSSFMHSFVKDAEAGNHKENGWPDSAYGMTKLGVMMATVVQQAKIDGEHPGKDILVNCCCPGYVDTDMTSHKGPLTIDQGAEHPLYLSLLSPKAQSHRGCFYRENKIVDWMKA